MLPKGPHDPAAPATPAQIEDHLREKSALIDLSYEPIFVWDFVDGIVEWNAGSELMYGYSRAQAIGRHSHELLQTVHPAPLEEFLKTLLRERQWSGELRHRTS